MTGPDETGRAGEGQAQRAQSRLLPSSMTNEIFGKVYVQEQNDSLRIEFTIWMRESGEGWKTGIAIDGSSSMREWYGRMLTGKIPENELQQYERKGWLRTYTKDGVRRKGLTPQAHRDALERGYLTFTDNVVQPVARDFMAYLAGNLDVDGRTTAIYWACGDGSKIEEIADVSEEQCHSLAIGGPKEVPFGVDTKLAPAMRYFVERFTDAKQALFVMITDGRLDDLDEVRRYTTALARDIAAERRKPLKCILIGVGESIDEAQMEELDDLDTGTDVDIWDHKIAKEMRDLSEIVVELVDENTVLQSPATIYDASGQVVERFTDGLPVKVSFALPASSEHFELEVGDQRVRQPVTFPQQ